jgi:pimeloyl-ACP methyl ester carboxylesterase
VIGWGALAALGLLVTAPAGAAAQPGRSHSVVRTDGSRLVYHVDRPQRAARAGAILVLQGSGCDPVGSDARVIGYGRSLAPERMLVTIEKYGVGSSASGETVEGCSADYWRGNTLTRRVLDALAVIAALRQEPWWNGDVVLFGGSEGGAVAAMLAPFVPETRAVIVYSSGIGVPVGELVRRAVPPPVREQADAVFAEARRSPDSTRRWGGASYAWWADAVDQVPARSLLQTRSPILLIHGSRDQFADVATARASRDLLSSKAGGRFTYREYAGYDHFMTDAAGVDHRPEVFAAARDWLRRVSRR